MSLATRKVTKIHKKVKIHWFRSPKNLLMFTNWMHREECMEMCPKYQRSRGVSFTDQGGMAELIDWARRISTDPDTGLYYEDDSYISFWLPFT